MANNRLPKAVFYSELRQGKTSHGGQKLRFKDELKWHMKKTGISHDTWDEESAQRVKWRGLLRKATLAVEGQRQQEYQRAHVRRHSAATSSSFQCKLSALCNNCQRSNATTVSVTADPERVSIATSSSTSLRLSSAVQKYHKEDFSSFRHAERKDWIHSCIRTN